MIRAFAFAVAVLGPLSLPAQQQTTWRCRHLLAEDGKSWRDDVVVATAGDKIASVQPAAEVAKPDVDLGEVWVIPGLIDLHTHMLLHPYNEAIWDDQVKKESLELRSMRATAHAHRTLLAGFVAVRDLGTEGAAFADVALQRAMAEGAVRGPRLFASTRAIVLRGCYGPDPEDPSTPKGAQCAAGVDEVRQAVREQAAAGANWVKVYADYRHGSRGAVAPTFSLEELQALCDEAAKAHLPVAAHATTDEGIRRAVVAGVRTVEHGQGASDATLALMKEKGVVLCPCLAANEAVARYAGRSGPAAARLNPGKAGFQRALATGVTIACGSDAGVFAHGDNAREIELMVEDGMTPAQALAAATSVAARVLGADDLGVIRPGARCGLVALGKDPLQDIHALRDVRAVIRERDERVH
jgi:imidazolonepropionase-like amidohydrolase